MVSITASITVEEITEALGIFDNLSKVLVQRMFGMNFFRPFPGKYNFYMQPWNVIERQVYAGEDSLTIGLRQGETDGSKAAVMAYIVKAASSHIDLAGAKVAEPEVPDEPETPPPEDVQPNPETNA